ncbi:TetR/AcrR family transcriptional regulator [Vibrio gazogenes]|uniref:Transcriptional regulator, TetR family n=1 Tax=Vibrio gazogenes DSM 21264 = NBRC 103151 TaxID=1123492 RepID=A0A1M4ZDB7_VIBGA|nr:TetR/AcrR family transcriptional regulator [Vibrio gazogenes]USP12443.1 TetR/AcrR family transcriptional regulator [Vibrio gazogenes]SHF16049.1 transcriptional regulator, TetR family [Vibrio gazogenes DSM 21264] [Vibrio gazogenes DSM 21264 = NBRC 103151]SJN53834.1 DNA-binding transcriptional repressor AcrR [Vibrio gazogenes]
MRIDAKKNYDSIISVAREIFIEQGASASLREVARRAGVGMGTFYRHFPTREALLEVLLRESFDSLSQQAEKRKNASDPDEALLSWVQDVITFTYNHRGIISVMMEAIEDLDSALHVSCHSLRCAGSALLTRAQSEGRANPELTGEELFDLIAALAWLREQPSHAPRAEHLFHVMANSVIMK